MMYFIFNISTAGVSEDSDRTHNGQCSKSNGMYISL